MAESLARIHASLSGLSRREQRNLLLQAGFGALAAWFLAWALLAAAVNAEVATSRGGRVWIGALVVAGLVAGAWPLRRLRAARDARRQAARVEALRPDLAGALLTVLDRTARPQGSPLLLARIAVRSATVVEAVGPATVHPSTPVRRVAMLAAAALALLGLAAVALPRGPIEALAALRAPLVVAPPTQAPVTEEGPHALVGDITLRYLYPTYTGREPLEVPNSNGEVHAPPGTRVEIRARTGEAYPTAALVVYDGAPEAVEIADGRSLRTAFTVAGPGTWRFLFGTLPSPDYRIVPEPDLPPDVTVQARQKVQTLALDESVGMLWSARDDFGLQRVVVEVDEGGKKREVPVRTPLDTPRELGGPLSLTPAQLGLAPGASAKLRVAAWDNDAISGSKAGYSSVVEIEVIGPHGKIERTNRYRRLLRDALVQVLADFLLDPSPPVEASSDAAAWATTAGGRYDAFDKLVQEAWGGAEQGTFDMTLLREVRAKRRELIGFAGSLGAGTRIADKDVATFVSLQDANVGTLEKAILMLDQVLRAAAMESLSQLVSQVAAEAKELQHDFASLSKEGAMARLDQLQRLYQQILRESAKLDRGALQEFLNDRSGQVQLLMEQIRKALAEGRLDDARELMDRLATQMQEMASQIDDMQQQHGADNDKLKQALEEVQQELQGLQADQAKLREKTEAARDKYGEDLKEAVDSWKEIERLSSVVTEQLGTIDAQLEPFQTQSWTGNSILEETLADAGGLHDSARARDLETALQRADQVWGEMGMLKNRTASAIRRAADGGPGLVAAATVIDAQQANVEKIRELLEKMANRQTNTSPALQKELRDMAEEQQQLGDRAQKTADHADKVSKSLPMNAPGLEEGAKRGAEEAKRAAQAMRDGEPMAAEGGQRSAEDGFRQAQDALSEAQRNMQQMEQASQGEGQGEGQGKDGQGDHDKKSGNGDDVAGDDMTLPAPEAFKTPEEYRRALLDGMEGDVPEEYKALNRRYYEELVRQ